MNKKDYFKYYIQGSCHYLIPKDVFDELFGEMESWKKDTQKYKEVIEKEIEYIESKNDAYCIKNGEEKGAFTFLLDFDEAREFIWKLLDILKEVKNESN